VGPVVIGAIRILIKDRDHLKYFLKGLKKAEINDSKKISSKKRVQILKSLEIQSLDFRTKGKMIVAETECEYVTWEMSAEIIDDENILWASLRGMKEASLFLSHQKKIKTTVLIDGHKKFKWDNISSPFTEIPIVKGDSKSLLIGLASIIAKEKRSTCLSCMRFILLMDLTHTSVTQQKSTKRPLRNLGQHPSIGRHSEVLKNSSPSRGESLEIFHSVQFHSSSSIPILISPALLRIRNLGQLDLVKISKDQYGRIIEIGEVKSSPLGIQSAQKGQKLRLLASGRFFSWLIGARLKFTALVGK
jgi:ribonuclease HII